MLKLTKEMPSFLENNKLILNRNSYLKNSDAKFNYYSSAYMTTNENLNDFFYTLRLKNKNILSVVGSGDYIFNAVLRGAKNIDGFDISIYAIMFYYLKEAALYALDYEDFIAFFYYPSDKRYFSSEIYFKIRPYLNYVALPFWNLVMIHKGGHELIENVKKTPIVVEEHFSKIENLSLTYDKSYYNILRKNIKNTIIRIFLADFEKLDYLKGPYDYILLSNIVNYVEPSIFKTKIEEYKQKLSEGGEIKNYLLFPNFDLMHDYDHILELRSAVDIITGNEDDRYFGGNYVLTKKKN